MGSIAGLILAEMIPIGSGGSVEVLSRPILALLGGLSSSVIYSIINNLEGLVGSPSQGDTEDLVKSKIREAEVRLAEQTAENRMVPASQLLHLKQTITSAEIPDEVRQNIYTIGQNFLPLDEKTHLTPTVSRKYLKKRLEVYMEYLLVTFVEKRRVIIDNIDTGQHTGEVIELEAGHHDIVLSSPDDFKPPVQSILLKDSNELDPREVSFAKKKPSIHAIPVLVFCFLAACSHYPENVPLRTYQPDNGYVYPAPSETVAQDKLFIALAFSGGGTRASAFSYGVLKGLEETALPEKPDSTLLDEVDVISSVSGGSFTAAYYGLYHKEIFTDFKPRFLNRDIQGELVQMLFNPVNWFKLASPYYSRIDMAQELYDQTVFNGSTFENLVQQRRHPFIALNATNMTTGSQFTFTQPQFDVIGSDLDQFAVSRAVAASSAFPFLLSPISLLNHPSPAHYELPLDVVKGLKDFGINDRRYFWAKNRAEYQNNKADHPYLHLMDGGLSDNLGLRYIMDEYVRTSGLLFQRKGTMQHLVVIVVNAKTQTPESLDLQEKSPGLKDVAYKTSTVSMDNYSFETVEVAKEFLKSSVRSRKNIAACQKILDEHAGDGHRIRQPGHHFDVHFIELNFLKVKDELLKEKLLALPTNFSLNPEDVQLLIDTGRELLFESDDFKDLLQVLAGN